MIIVNTLEDDEKFFFDQCAVKYVNGMAFNEYSLSIPQQLKIVRSKKFEQFKGTGIKPSTKK